jgi:betaine-aldehyde dehydrogenase
MQNYKMWIGGKWVDAESGKTFAAYNPATGEEIARVPSGDKADVDKAVTAARKAFPIWSKRTPAQRSDILLKLTDAIVEHASELGAVDSMNLGSPLKKTQWIMGIMANTFKYAAEVSRGFMGRQIPARPDKLVYLQREPRGVCALFYSWNGTLISAAKKLAAALATGNTCILKAPSNCPLSIFKFGEVLEKLDLPEGTVNILSGPGGAMGELLTSHPGVDFVSLTGGVDTGKRMMALAGNMLKDGAMELGGKNPWIIMEDADIDAAVDDVVFSSFDNSGMACTASGRIYLHKSIHDEFIEKFVARAKSIIVGDPQDEKTTMGPVVSASHRESIEAYIKSGIEQGAKLIIGGKRPTEPPLDKGYYVMPTIFTDVTQNMKIAREEIFGPVAVFLRFSSEEEVVGFANDSNVGLAACIWSKDVTRSLRMASEIQAGTVWINGPAVGPDYPWGGFKESGIGKEVGIMGMEQFTQYKLIALDLTQRIQKP